MFYAYLAQILIISNFFQFGSFHHNSSLYVIQPGVSGGDRGEGHVVSRVPDQKLTFEGVSPKGTN